MSNPKITIGICVLLSAVLSQPVLPQTGDDNSLITVQKRMDDEQLLEGLRRRRLFEIAEFYCRDELAAASLDPTTETSLVIEWMKTRMAKAILANPQLRVEAWQAVDQVASDFLATHRDHPRKFLLDVQRALTHIAHSKLIRQEIDADMAEAGARVNALEEVKLARSLLSDLQREIEKAIPDQRSRSLSEHDLTPEQLMSLNNNVQYQLAVCNLNRAQLYELTDRLNRMDALNGVKLRLDEVQRTAAAGQPLWWLTKLGQVECLQLLGQPKSARALLESLPQADAPPETKLMLLEQAMGLAVELGDESYSQKLFTEFENVVSPTPQLELAVLELAVDLSARAATEERKQEWLAFASNSANSIEQKFGGYWGRRADLILIATTGSSGGTALANDRLKLNNSANSGSTTAATNSVELEMLTRLADEAYRKQRFDDALKAYERAAQLATSVGAMESALRADLRVGMILESKGEHRSAATALTNGANRDPDMELSASVHLRGCWNFAKSIERLTDAELEQARSEYRALLNDHLARWAGNSSSNQARIYLGSFLQGSQDWEAAIEAYLAVDPASEFFDSAIEYTESCAKQWLGQSTRAGHSTLDAASQLNAEIAGVQRGLPVNSAAAIKLELIQRELDSVYGSRRPAPLSADRFEAMVQSSNKELANTAKALQAVALCEIDLAQARQLVTEIGGDERSLSLVDRCLAGLELNGENKNAFELRLEIIMSALALPSMEQPEAIARKTGWMLKKSEALSALDRQSEATEVLTELEKQFPRNAGVQLALARAMTAQYGDSDPEKPLLKWRRIADRLQPYSPSWFEAKYEVCRLIFQTGDKERAGKLLKYIQLNPPGWDASPLKPKFEELLRRCGD